MRNVLRNRLGTISRTERLLLILFLLATSLTFLGVSKAYAGGSGCPIDLVHTSTSANTHASYTILNDTLSRPLTARSVLFMISVLLPQSVSDPHPLGVYYSGTTWKIFNEDKAPMPVGASFNIIGALERITATPGVNSSGNYVIIDLPALINNPVWQPIVTPNWEPNQVFDPHPLEVQYFFGRWIIWNADGAPMPAGASFNIF